MASVTGQRLLAVKADSAEGQRLLRDIRSTYLDTQYRTGLNFEQLFLVKNDTLARKFQDKKRDLYAVGGNAFIQEMHVFACFKRQESVLNIISDGAMVKPSVYNFLGRSDLGVNLCRHADVQLKSAESGTSRVKRCWLVVFKVLPGRTLNIPADESVKFPTQGYDSHMSSTRALVNDSLHVQAINSQIYLYEFTNSQQLAIYPTNVLPYAVLTFSKSESMGQPQSRATDGVSHQPAVQQPSQHQLPMQQMVAAHNSGSNLMTQQRTISHGNIQQGPPPLTPITSQGQPQQPHVNYSASRQVNQRLPMTDPRLRTPYQEQMSSYTYQQPSSSAVMPNVGATGSEMRYPPNRTATATQLPFHAADTSDSAALSNYQQLLQQELLLRQMQEKQAQQKQLQQQQQQQQQHSTGYGGLTGLSNMQQNISTSGTATVNYRPPVSSTVVPQQAPPRPRSAGLGMRLPTVVSSSVGQSGRYSADNNTVNSISARRPSVPTPASSYHVQTTVAGTSQPASLVTAPGASHPPTSFPSVITIQPEGTAPHEDPTLLGVWPWVKTEPQISGYGDNIGENPYHYTKHLDNKRAGTEAMPIIIEPIDSPPPPPPAALVHNADQPQHATSSSSLFDPYPPSVHFSSNLTVALDLSSVSISDSSASEQHVTSSVVTGTVSSQPTTSSREVVDPVSSWVQKNISGTQRSEPLSDRDEFQRLYGSDPYRTDLQGPCSTSSTTPATSASPLKSKPTFPTLTEHGTSKPRPSIVSVSSTWDVPLMTTGGRVAPRILRTSSTASSRHSRSSSLESSSQHNVPNTHTVVPGDSSSTVDESNPNLTALLSSGMVPSSDRTTTASLGTNSTTVTTPKPRNAFNPFSTLLELSTSTSVSTTSTVTMAVTTGVTSTVASSSVLVASTSSLKIGNGEHSTKMVCSDPVQTSTQTIGERSKLSQHESDVPSSLLPLNVPVVSSGSSMQSSNGHNTIKPNINAGISDTTNSETLDSVHKVDLNLLSNEQISTSKADEIGILSNFKTDKSAAQKNTEKTANYLSKMLPSETTDSGNINVEPMELDFMLSETNQSSIRDTAKEDKPEKVEPLILSISGKKSVLSNASSRSTTSAITNEQDIIVGLNTSKGQQSGKDKSQSFIISSQTVAKSKDAVSDPAVSSNLMRTGDGSSLTVEKPVKKKKKRLQKSQYTSLSSLKKLIERQKVVVAEDGTIQLVNETVYKTASKETSGLSAAQIAPPISVFKAGDKENKKSKKENKKRKKEKKHKLQKTGIISSSSKVIKPDTPKVLIASPQTKQKVPVSKKSGSPRSHLYPVGKTGLKYKLKANKKSFAVKSSSLSSATFVKPKPFITPFDRFGQGNKAQASDDSLDEGKIPHQAHLSFGILNSNMGIGNLSPAIAKSVPSVVIERAGTPSEINVSEALNSKEYQPVVRIECDIQKHLHKYKIYEPSDMSVLSLQPKIIPLVPQDQQLLDEEPCELILKISEVTSLEETAFSSNKEPVGKDNLSSSDEGLAAETSMSDTDIPSTRRVTLKGSTEKVQITIKPVMSIPTGETDTDINVVSIGSKKNKKRKKKTKKKSKERVPPLIVQTKKGRAILNSEVSEDDNKVSPKKDRKLKHSKSQSKGSGKVLKDVQQSESDSDVVRKKKKRKPKVLSKQFVEDSDESDSQTLQSKPISPLKLIIQSSNDDKDFRVLTKSNKKQPLVDTDAVVGSVKGDEKETDQISEKELERIVKTENKELTKITDNPIEDNVQSSEPAMTEPLNSNNEITQDGERGLQITERRYDGRAALPDVVMSSKEVCEKSPDKWSDAKDEVIENLKNENQIYSFIKSCRIESDKAKYKPVSGSDRERERIYRRRTRSRSYSRSPERRRRRRTRSSSRSRSRSPYQRSKHSRKYSRSPSPWRNSRSPRSRRRYSRSPSPYRSRKSRRSRSPRRRSPRRRRSRSPSSWKRYSRSPSPRRRSSRSPSSRYKRSRSRSSSLRRNRSRSRSPSLRHKRSRSPAKRGRSPSPVSHKVIGPSAAAGSRPYSPSSPTESPTKELSPAGKKLSEKRKTAVDELFAIAYGKTPVASKASSGTSTVATALTTTTATTAVSTVTSSSVPCTLSIEDSKAISKKLSFSQYKKRHGKGSTGSMDSSIETDKSQPNESKKESGEKDQSHEAKTDTADVDDADIALIQEQYSNLKATIDTMPADEDKLEFMIEYKRVGDQLKQLKAQQSGETGNALEPLKVNFSSMNQPWPNTSSPVSPRPKQQNRGSGLASGLWRSSSCSSAVSEKPDWDISTFEPESEKRGEMFNAYSGPPKEASPQVNKEINIKALLETIKDIPKTLGLPPTTSSTTVNNDAVQNILNMAKAQGNIGLPSSSSASSVPSLMSGIKPLMADLKTPSAGYIRSISMPAVESNEQPTFYTGIHSGSSMKKNTPVFSRQVSPYASTSVRDPRLNRRDSSDTSQTTGLSPRDSAGISPRGGTSPRVDVALQGMASPPHASPRYNPYPQSSTQQQNQGQDQQLSVYNPPPLNRRHPQQQSHPPMPGYPPPPEGHFLPPLPPTDPPIPDPPLKLIPIDVPEINYEGMKGSLDDPRFMPRDAEVWNPFPTKGPPRHIPLDVAKIYENDDMEISDTEDTSEIIGESSDSSFTLMEQATTKIIKSPNVAIAARDPRLSITARKNKTENTVETQIQKPKEIQDNSSTTSTDAQVINPQSKKRPVVAAAQWANLSKNWETSGTDQRPYVSHKIGKSNKQVLTLINHVESLSSNELDTFAVEMNRQLDITMSNVMKESLFCDPTDGITAEKRLELIEDNSVNPAVLGELKLEHHLFQLDKVINTLKETLANLGEQMQQPSCPQNIVAEYDQNEERLHAVELAREHEHKRLEKDLRRYQKSDCVELIPEEFLLAGEIDGYITEEGCLLFLLERLSLSDCRNLYCYKIEIERCTGNLEKLSGMDIAEVRKCRKMIGYWHSQRRLLLISICCASIKKKQELTERFIDKLAWYRTVQTEIEKQEGNTNTQEVMLAFAAERIERLETYLNILRHVQLSKNAWEPIEPVEEIPHAEKQSPQSKAPTSASISTSASIKPAFNTTSAILPLSSSHPTQHENIKSPPTVAPVSVKSNVSFTLREKLKNAESQKQEAKGNETGEVSGKKTTKEKVLDSSLGNVKRKSLDSQVEVKKTLTQSKTERRKSVDDSGVQSEAKATVKPLQSETAPSRNNNNADDSHNKDKTKTIEKKISSKEKDNDLNLNNAEKLSVKCSEKQTTKSSKVERDKEHVEKAHKPLDKQSSKEGKSHKISDHTDKLSKQSSKPRKSSESEQISKEKNIKPRKSSESEQISKEKLIKPCKSSEGESEQKSNEKHSKPHKSSDTEQKANEKHHKPKKSSETEQKSNEKHNKPHKSSETEQKSKEKHNKPNKSSETELKSKEKHSSAESKSNKHGKSSKSDSVKEPLEQKAEESKSNKHGKSSKIDSVNEPLEQKAEISVQKTQKVTKDSKSVKSKPVQPSEKTKLKHDVASNKTDEHEKHKMHKKHSKDEKHKASGSAPSQFSSSKVKSGKESVQQFSSKTFTSKPTVETNTDEKSKGLANKSSDKIFKSSAEEKSIRRSNCKESHLSSKHLGVVSNNPGATAKVSDSISKDKKSNEKHSGDKEFSSAARESSKESNTTKESKSSTLKEYKSGSLHGVATTSRRAPRKSIKIVVPVPLHETLQRCVSPGICDSLGFKETSMEPDSLPNIVTPSLSSDDKVKPSSSKSTPVSCNIKSVNISDKKLSDITSKVSVSFPRLILKRSDENVTSAKIIKKPGKGGKFKGIKLAKSTASTTLEGKGAEVKINVDKTNYSESVTSQTIVTTTVTGSIATTSSASSVTSSLGTKVIFSSSSSSMPDGQIKLTTKPKLEKVPSGLESALASTLESGKSVTSDAEKMLTITSREQTNSDKSNSKKSVNEARVDAVKCIKASRVTAAKSTEVKKDIERSDQSIDAKIGSIVDKVISGKLHTEGKSAAEKSKSDHGVFDGIKTSSVKEIMENPETKIKAGQSIKDKNEITNEPNNQSAKSKETNKAKTETKDNIAQSSSKISKAKAIFATISEKTVDVGPSKKGSSKADNTKSMTGQIELEIEKELSASKGVKTIKASVVKPTSCDSITLPMNKKKALPMDTKSILKSTQSMDDTDVKITDSKEGDDINKARTSKNSGPKTNIQVTQKDKSIKTLGVVSKSVPTAIKKGVITVRRLSSDVQTNTGASKPIIPTVLKPVPTQTKVKPGANIPVIPLETITSPPKTCVIEKNVHEDDKEKETTKMSQIKAKLVPSTSEDSDIPQIPLECKASPEANSKGQKESKLSGEVPKIGQKRARSPELSMAEETNKKQKISTVKQDTSVTKNMSEYEMKEKPKIRAIRTLSNNSEPRSGYKRTRSRSPGPSRRSRSPESKRHRSRARSGSPAIPWRMKVRSGEFSPRRRGSRDWSPHQNVNKAESPGQSPSHQSSSGRGRSPRHRARSPGKRSPNRRSGSMDRSYPKRSRSPSRRGSPSVRKWTAPPRGRSPNERSWPPQARSPHQSESSGWKNWSSHDAPARRSPGRRNPSPERWSSPGRYQNETDWTPETHQRKQSPYYGSADEGRHSPFEDYGARSDDRSRERPLHTRRSPRNAPQRAMSPPNRGRWSPIPDKFEEGISVEIYNDSSETRTVAARGRGRGRGSPRGRPRGRGRGRGGSSSRGRGRGRGTKTPDNRYVGGEDFPHDQDERMRNPNTSWSSRTEVGCSSRGSPRGRGRTLRSSAESSFQNVVDATADIINSTLLLMTNSIQQTGSESSSGRNIPPSLMNLPMANPNQMNQHQPNESGLLANPNRTNQQPQGLLANPNRMNRQPQGLLTNPNQRNQQNQRFYQNLPNCSTLNQGHTRQSNMQQNLLQNRGNKVPNLMNTVASGQHQNQPNFLSSNVNPNVNLQGGMQGGNLLQMSANNNNTMMNLNRGQNLMQNYVGMLQSIASQLPDNIGGMQNQMGNQNNLASVRQQAEFYKRNQYAHKK